MPAHIRAAFRKRSLPFPWPRGDWSLALGRGSICSSIAARRIAARLCCTFWASRSRHKFDKKPLYFVRRMNKPVLFIQKQGPDSLTPLAVSLMIFVCTFAAAIFGMILCHS